MNYFDMHVHPTLKAGLTNDSQQYNAWTNIPFFARGVRYLALKGFEEIIISQANLSQLQKAGTVSVIALIGLEKAFAGNWAIQKILASPRVSPLDRKLLIAVVNDELSYYDLFLKDLNVLLNSPGKDDFNLINKFDQVSGEKVNLILSVEGMHSFQSVKDNTGETEINKSILSNFAKWKNDQQYRLHHVTLTHLTRQPACVHCFGVNIMVLGFINLTRDVNFQPDPLKVGIAPLGIDIIKEAYDSSHSKLVLVDIKHMSYYSRLQFYQLRKDQQWESIPLIASHIGVTGTSFSEASLSGIEENVSGCDLVSWNRKEGLRKSYFNPWTINLFDEDILEVLKSGGIMGISLDQRILGYQKKFFGEFMSHAEVNLLPFPAVEQGIAPLVGFERPLPLTSENEKNRIFIEHPELMKVLQEEDKEFDLHEEDIRGNDMVFDVDEEEMTVAGTVASHIDYLSNNILHIIKVGFQHDFDGKVGNPDVTDHICIGSDLDGIADSANFPKPGSDSEIDKKDWITADEYPRLQKALSYSMKSCITEDSYLESLHLNVDDIVEKIMRINGMQFLQKHFN